VKCLGRREKNVALFYLAAACFALWCAAHAKSSKLKKERDTIIFLNRIKRFKNKPGARVKRAKGGYSVANGTVI